MRAQAAQVAVAFMLALACSLAPLRVVAQTPAAQQSPSTQIDGAYDEYFMSDEHRQKIYDANRKRVGKAVLYNCLLPGLGNIYAEQYLLAGLAFVFVAFSATFIGYGLANEQSNVVAVGGVTALIAYGGSIGTSIYGVSNHNRELRQGLKIGQTDVREVWAPALTLRF